MRIKYFDGDHVRTAYKIKCIIQRRSEEDRKEIIMAGFLKKSLLFLTSVAIVSTALISINEKPVRAGSEKESIASDFTLENVNGENVSLKDFRGSIVVLGMVFGDKAAHDIEKYLERLNSDFKEKGINCLKVVQVNKPIFITKKFIRSKMKKQFKYSPDCPKTDTN